METPNLTLENVEKIEKLFPNCVKETEDEEGNKVKKIDFDLLRAELWDKASVEWLEERYRLDWPWKKRSILKANTPITKTLRPVKEDSVDWDNTWNLYIEWDNFEALKTLQESYLWKIDCIYIDPPYNTGNDFVYNDDFSENSEEYKERTEQNSEWYKIVKNTESNWRFHSDWLSMMYERLKIARDLLSDDGLIFISIDDNEKENLKKVCDEIFWENNFLNTLVRKKNSTTIMLNKEWFSACTEYIYLYKKWNIIQLVNDPISEKLAKSYNKDDNDWKWPYWSVHLYTNTNWNKKVALRMPDWTMFEAKRQVTQEKLDEYAKEWLVFKTPTWWRKKIYLSNCKWSVPITMLDNDVVWTTKTWTSEIQNLLWNIFSYPKPVSLIKYILSKYPKTDATILDFFSWSGTTAHACMQLNAEDWWNRKFIMVQLPELTEENSDAYKAGYKNICEIWKERIRRAWKRIKDETNADIDYGFRVYRVDESCMKDVYYHPSEAKQETLALFTSNIKEDRTPEDLLTQVILNFWLTLDLPIEEKTIWNNKVFYVAWNSLIACFDENIDDNVIDEIAKDEPIKLVFRDACFKNDAQRINVENKVKRVSPETIIKVI